MALIHPTLGVILFDTGYSQNFRDITRQFPYNLYAFLTPVHLRENETALAQLKNLGVSQKDVRHIIISHFHADHISALKDFPYAQFIYLQDTYSNLSRLKGIKALVKGFLPELLPEDFEQRSKLLSYERFGKLEGFEPFVSAIDIFEDESILGVALPGHARGQLGIITNPYTDPVFFVADACWQTASYQTNTMPSKVASFIQDDVSQYANTLEKIHLLSQRRPDLKIVPCHSN